MNIGAWVHTGIGGLSSCGKICLQKRLSTAIAWILLLGAKGHAQHHAVQATTGLPDNKHGENLASLWLDSPVRNVLGYENVRGYFRPSLVTSQDEASLQTP